VLGIAGISPGTRVYDYAQPYVWVRALTFIPAIIATVGFSAFRGCVALLHRAPPQLKAPSKHRESPSEGTATNAPGNSRLS